MAPITAANAVPTKKMKTVSLSPATGDSYNDSGAFAKLTQTPSETEREHAIGSGRPYVRTLGDHEVTVLADPARMEVEFLPPRFMAWFHGRGWTPRRHQLEMVQTAREGR